MRGALPRLTPSPQITESFRKVRVHSPWQEEPLICPSHPLTALIARNTFLSIVFLSSTLLPHVWMCSIKCEMKFMSTRCLIIPPLIEETQRAGTGLKGGFFTPLFHLHNPERTGEEERDFETIGFAQNLLNLGIQLQHILYTLSLF